MAKNLLQDFRRVGETSATLSLRERQGVVARDELIDDARYVFRALADQNRLRIIFSLSGCRELNVRSICELLELNQPAVSHHLKTLLDAGLVLRRKNGKQNLYRLDSAKIESTFSQFGKHLS